MYEIGQQLWYVPEVGQHFYVTITKIGRKWIYADHLSSEYKINKETLVVDDYPYGKCYLSQEDHMSKVEILEMWRNLGREVFYHVPPPKGLTADDIRKAMVILKLMPDIERLPDGTPDGDIP